jgi:hypothetical protein
MLTVVSLLMAIAFSAVAANEIWILRIDDEIGTGTVTYLRNGLSHAEEANAALGVLVLSTPAGVLSQGGARESRKDLKARALYGLDAGTAFEILSMDIADVDVGKNIGAPCKQTRRKRI